MGIAVRFRRLCHFETQRLLLIIGIIVAGVVVFQFYELPYGNYMLLLSSAGNGSLYMMVGEKNVVNKSTSANSHVVLAVANEKEAAYENETGEKEMDFDFVSDDDGDVDYSFEVDEDGNSHSEFTFKKGITVDKSLAMRNVRSTDNSSTREEGIEFRHGPLEQVKKSDNNVTLDNDRKTNTSSTLDEVLNPADFSSLPLMSPVISTNGFKNLDANSSTSILFVTANMSSVSGVKQSMGTQPKDKNTELLQTVSVTLNNNSTMASNSILKRRGKRTPSISQMNSLLLQSHVSSSSMRSRWSSVRDWELLSAKLQIENAPIIRNTPGLYASLFQNVSMFKRSYELMERMLKVYIYREGENPIFHRPYLRGIYASEGWFMKLIEGNKQFVVRDPRKAHLFYLPVSSKMLRTVLYEQNSSNGKDLQKFLKNYVDSIAEKYRFWNRTGGADHFLVACHDWANRVTGKIMGNCIRALCNANVAKGFKIGKDTSLPVTYVRKSEDPLKDLGGKPPSERPILAFFAGSMHGYLRPILLQYWENKEPDMKIFGPMPRDITGKQNYREHMKSSKYCICARGYEVHTPRVIEAIFYECVPVIISDNYVPPFFEVLDWEAFSLFVLEKDVPNLRNILLSIPEEKYLEMQLRVKMVQQHFLWHKKPVKYDLFHMVLHSVWYNRVFQIKPR